MTSKDKEIEMLRRQVSQLQEQLTAFHERERLNEERETAILTRMRDCDARETSNNEIILLLEDEDKKLGRIKTKRNKKARQKAIIGGAKKKLDEDN